MQMMMKNNECYDIILSVTCQSFTMMKIEVEKQWTWEDEKLMEAYACKKNMDEFRRIHRI